MEISDNPTTQSQPHPRSSLCPEPSGTRFSQPGHGLLLHHSTGEFASHAPTTTPATHGHLPALSATLPARRLWWPRQPPDLNTGPLVDTEILSTLPVTHTHFVINRDHLLCFSQQVRNSGVIQSLIGWLPLSFSLPRCSLLPLPATSLPGALTSAIRARSSRKPLPARLTLQQGGVSERSQEGQAHRAPRPSGCQSLGARESGQLCGPLGSLPPRLACLLMGTMKTAFKE